MIDKNNRHSQNRLAILDILREGKQCVCHLEAILGLRQAYISQQLMVLRECGIIQDRREGWNIFYCVVKPEVYELLDKASEVLGEPMPRSATRSKAHACPCPKYHPSQETLALPKQPLLEE